MEKKLFLFSPSPSLLQQRTLEHVGENFDIFFLLSPLANPTREHSLDQGPCGLVMHTKLSSFKSPSYSSPKENNGGSNNFISTESTHSTLQV